MKNLLWTWGAIFVLSLPGVLANASSAPPPTNNITYSFAIPQGVDPPVVIDLTSLNSQQSFTGAQLLDDGVEVHGQIDGLTPGTYRDILQVEFKLYTGGQSYTISVTTVPGFTAYNSSVTQDTDPNYEDVTLTAATGSAPINDHFQVAPGVDSSYLVITGSATGDATFLAALRASTVEAQATKEGTTDRAAVPEPGAIGIGVALLCCVGGCLLPKRLKR